MKFSLKVNICSQRVNKKQVYALERAASGGNTLLFSKSGGTKGRIDRDIGKLVVGGRVES